jgi:hypothetical protein
MSEDSQAIARLILTGALIPIDVFGGHSDPKDKMGHSDADNCPICGGDLEWGYGLCDKFSRHAPGGSDCNRAVKFMLRPSDDAMDSLEVRAALRAVVEDEEHWPKEKP